MEITTALVIEQYEYEWKREYKANDVIVWGYRKSCNVITENIQ